MSFPSDNSLAAPRPVGASVADEFQIPRVPSAFAERLGKHRSFLTICLVFSIILAVVLSRANAHILGDLSGRAMGMLSPRDQEPLTSAALIEASLDQGLAARISRPVQFQSAFLTRRTAASAQSNAGPELTAVSGMLREYTVRPGDTVWGLSQRLNLKAETLLWTNPDIDENTAHLSVGDRIVIPPVDGAVHTVATGDTLSDLAFLYEVDIRAITGFPANELDSNLILPGQRIFIPGGVRPPRAPPSYIAYNARSVPSSHVGTGLFVRPVRSTYVSQGYWANHRALDYAGPTGTVIVAADRGTVAYANFGWNHGYGHLVVIDHGNGFTSLYAHLSTILVRAGQNVQQGQIIGNMGSTGNSTGPHLHLEIRKDGRPLNPNNLLS